MVETQDKPRMLTILKDPGKGFLKENTYQVITSDKRSKKETVLRNHKKGGALS